MRKVADIAGYDQMTRKTIMIFGLLLIVLLQGCSTDEKRARERAERAKLGKGEILIAVVSDEDDTENLFVEGIEMAIAEINRDGGIMGRKLRALQRSSSSVKMDLQIGRELVANPDIVAVIGHNISSGAIPVSVIYEKSGMLFITGATSPLLTSHGFQLVFRNIPSDRQTGTHLANFASRAGFRKLAVIDDETIYGSLLARSFLESAQKIGLEIRKVKSYFVWQTDFRLMIDEIKLSGVDAIFLGANLPVAAEVIKQIREMGLQVPILGADGLDSPTLWRLAGRAAEGVIVSTVFNSQVDDDVVTRKFVGDFSSRYGVLPDTWAAQGYDAVKLLADSFSLAKSTVPSVVSSYLHFMVSRHGVAGSYSFTKDGDIVGKEMFFKVVRNGKFEFLPTKGSDTPDLQDPAGP